MSVEGRGLGARFSELGPRVRTGIALAVGFLALDIFAAFYCTGRWLAFVVALAIVICAAFETVVFSIPAGWGRRCSYSVAIVLPVMLVGIYISSLHSCETTVSAGASVLVAVKAAVVGVFLSLCAAFASGHRSIDAVSETMRELPLAVFLVGICGGALIALPLLPGGAWILLWLVVVVSTNDTAAYFVGSRVGGVKLCPAVSPNKTVAGSIGGILSGTVVGSLLGSLSTAETWGQSVLLSLAVIVAAQLGDLAKSYLKRLHGVKDSGRLLPGHGGVLDRIDGVLAGGLVVYVWAVGAW